jgi:hypothetical protein
LISSYRVQFHARRALACLFGLLLSVGLMHGTTQRGSDVRWLEEGKPIERELSGGESHSYRLNVTTGQYARVVVEQKGIDVVTGSKYVTLDRRTTRASVDFELYYALPRSDGPR